MFDLITISFKESSARQGAPNHQWQRPNFLLDTGQRMLPLLSSSKIGQQVNGKFQSHTCETLESSYPRERNLGRIYEKPMADRLCARIGGMGTGTIVRHSLFWFGKNRNFIGAGCKSGFRIKTSRSFSGRRADLIQSRPGVRAVLSVERRRCPLWRGTFQGARSQRSCGELGKGKISNISGMG